MKYSGAKCWLAGLGVVNGEGLFIVGGDANDASPMEINAEGPQNLEIDLTHDAAVQLLGIRDLHILIDAIDH